MIELFVDINCPFCFIQHERLRDSRFYDQIRWRYIEHMPGVVSATNSQRQADALKRELAAVVKRYPDTRIVSPGFRVNSHKAILTLMSIEDQRPEICRDLRTDIYRAYWIESRDISSTEVLAGILAKYDLRPVTDSLQVRMRLFENLSEWRDGDFDGRIPSLRTPDGRVLAGLKTLATIEEFLAGSDPGTFQSSVCNIAESQSIVGIGLDTMQRELLGNLVEYKWSFYDGERAFMKDARESRIDAVILNFSKGNARREEQLARLSALERRPFELPVICADLMYNSQSETVAFHLGAVDYLARWDDPVAVAARLRQRLKIGGIFGALTDQASVDSLTGLPNRRNFEFCLDREWRIGLRERKPLAVVVMDVDFFKRYNDAYGHVAGDECLRSVAHAFSDALGRPADMTARYGGEEFVALLPNTSIGNALVVSEQMRKAVERLRIRHPASDASDFVTISAGVASRAPSDDSSSLALFVEADDALYQAKDAGRNCSRAARMICSQDDDDEPTRPILRRPHFANM